MSAKSSFLSGPKYGYDYVVATTQASVNSGLKEYLANSTQPTTFLCFLADQDGQPVNQISLDDLKKQTGGIDPFDIPDGTTYSDPRITTLTSNMFVVGLRMKMGLPPGVMPKDLPPVVDFGSSANNVTFNLFCSELDIIQNNPPSGFGGKGSWKVFKQPPGAPWYFQTTCNLVYKDLDQLLNTPYFNSHPKEKAALLAQLGNLGSGAFSLQQLLLDLDNAVTQSVPTIEGLDPGSNAGYVLSRAFVNLYCATARAQGEPVLAVKAVRNAPDGSSLTLTGFEREVNVFVDGTGSPVKSPTPQQKNATTLCYLCAANGSPLPPAVGFNFNWVDLGDVASQSGAIAINRNTLANYFKSRLVEQIRPHCIQIVPSVQVWPGGTAKYGASLSSYKTPQTMTISASGPDVLTVSYAYNGDASDKSGATYGELDLHTSMVCTLNFSGNQIKITQHLTIWMKTQWDLTHVEGNIVDKTLVDTYTLSVNQSGQLVATQTGSTPSDASQDVSLDAFSNFFVSLNDIVTMVKKALIDFFSISLADFPVNTIQSFIFPGAKVFTYKDASFSENQDLVAAITYVRPS